MKTSLLSDWLTMTNCRIPFMCKGTNFCEIGFKIDRRCNRLILISAIDNLGKGAAGQAVQNMNLMCGLEETAGLDGVPRPLMKCLS